MYFNRIKIVSLIIFTVVLNVNLAFAEKTNNKEKISELQKDQLISHAEWIEYNTEGYLKSQFVVNSVVERNNETILKGRLAKPMISRELIQPEYLETPVDIELVFNETSLPNSITSSPQEERCYLLGRSDASRSSERMTLKFDKLVCKNLNTNHTRKIIGFAQDDKKLPIKAIAIEAGQRKLSLENKQNLEKFLLNIAKADIFGLILPKEQEFSIVIENSK